MSTNLYSLVVKSKKKNNSYSIPESSVILVFFFKRLYLFILERGERRERGRKTSV